ncbi:hypothetical protein D3C73_1184430 [compost metagenome]
MHEYLAFVVGGSASIQFAVTDFGFKRRSRPQVKGIDRLHIIVAIDQNGRLAGGMKIIGIDDRMACSRMELDVFQPRALQGIQQPVCSG